MSKVKKIMLHLIMPDQVSGPNTANRIIYCSFLNKKYEFKFLCQYHHSGNKFNLKLYKDLKQQIKGFDPDLIHISGLQTSGFYAVLAAKSLNKKILIAIRGFSGSTSKLNFLKRFMYNKIIEPYQLKHSTNFYTVSKYAQRNKMLLKYSDKNLGYIHNSAPIIDEHVIRHFDRTSIGIHKEDFVIVYTGRVTYDKGIRFLCESLKDLDNTKIKLIIVGEGPYTNTIKTDYNALINKNIFLLGKRNDVISILKECDAFVFPTLHENLSNSLLEACVIPLPIIATNVGGNPEIIKHMYNGLLINPKSSKEITYSIRLLANNEPLRNYISRNAKHFVDAYYSQEKLLSDLDCFYEKILSIKE